MCDLHHVHTTHFYALKTFDPGKALTWKGGTGMCGPQDPGFHASPAIHKTPVKAQIRLQDPHLKEKCDTSTPKSTFLENMTIFSSRSSNLAVKKLGNFAKLSVLKPLFCYESPLTRPHFHSILSAHKPPSSEILAANTY